MSKGVFPLAATLVLSSACATTEIKVSRVPDANEQKAGAVEPAGLRYSLPKPFLLVSPASEGNGSFTAQVIYLPNECETYAIDAKTKRGQYELGVTLKDGLLSKVTWSEKNAELLAESLKSGGTILNAELERQNNEKKERQTKADAEKAAAEKEVKDLETDLNKKQLELNLAAVVEAAAREVVEGGDQSKEAKDALQKAVVDLDKATAARDFASQLVDQAKAKAAALPGAMNKAQDTTNKVTGDQSLFWSPVLYAIDDTGTAVRLRAVEWKENPAEAAATPSACSQQIPGPTEKPQTELKTTKVPKAPEEPAKPPKILGSTDIVRIWRSGALRLTVVLDKPVNGLKESERAFTPDVDNATPITPPPFQTVLGKDRQSIRIEFPGPVLAARRYKLTIPFTYGKDNKPDSLTILLTIQQ